MSLDFYLYSTVDVGGESPEEAVWAQFNITHNLTRMAQVLGVYRALWRPDEYGYTHARDVIPWLQSAMERIDADPERYRAFESANGWGLLKNFRPWLERVYNACKRYPGALIRASR